MIPSSHVPSTPLSLVLQNDPTPFETVSNPRLPIIQALPGPICPCQARATSPNVEACMGSSCSKLEIFDMPVGKTYIAKYCCGVLKVKRLRNDAITER